MSALAFGALAAARLARAAEPRPQTAQVDLIFHGKDTDLYHVAYDGHTCFVASTIGGSGISLQCLK